MSLSLPDAIFRHFWCSTCYFDQADKADHSDVDKESDKRRLVDEDLTRSIIGAFYDAYNELGFGFLESVCVEALCEDLRRRGHVVDREVQLRVHYRDKIIAWHRIDILVERRVVVEVKAGDTMAASARLQLSSYLRGIGLEVGLLLHFGPKPTVTRLFIPNKRKSD